MTCTAFVSGPAAIARPSVALSTSSFSARPARPTHTVARKPAAVRMVAPLNTDEPDKSIPQGFTLFSEKLNGRMAMIGFVAALGAEIFSPAHPTVVEQVSSVFTTVTGIF